jgi:hypothetical protein
MSLHKIKDFDPNYNTHSTDPDIKGLSMYAGTEKIGSVNDVLVDDEGKFRYLVVDTGAWIMGKKVLLGKSKKRSILHDRQNYKPVVAYSVLTVGSFFIWSSLTERTNLLSPVSLTKNLTFEKSCCKV